MAVVDDVLDVEAAVNEIVRSALRAVARAADDDQLRPESADAVTAVLSHLIADAAIGIPAGARISLLAGAHDMIGQFTRACAGESA